MRRTRKQFYKNYHSILIGVTGPTGETGPAPNINFRAEKNVNQVIVPNTVFPISYENIVFNNGSGYDASISFFIAPISGIYLFTVNVGFIAFTVPVQVAVEIRRDGATLASNLKNFNILGSGLGNMSISSTTIMNLAAGQGVSVHFSSDQATEVIADQATSFSSGTILS
ncbi:C1q-like domain-containing protein [Bacillus toyonensis]|uniref:C1q domain-containing protein n=1 Tax=Bacillus toyonensis TaxID=155322 RepID=A0AB73R5X0_9BACI|nr:hypothetical protein [Bacillus toyonensis]PEI83423.1 hypothetical protein CN678_24230 [Bacillus toyonensis]